MKRQHFVRPDAYFAVTGDLKHFVHTVAIPGAPAFMKGVRAAFVSDVHATARTTRVHYKNLADSIIAIRPDILLLGGDHSDLSRDAMRFYESLKDIQTPLGKYAVLGNNDLEDWPGEDALRAVMSACGIELLVNASRNISVNGGDLCIAGVDEHLEGRPDSRGLYPEKGSQDMYRILLSHYPCVPEVKPDLMLSGHTHGGQFNCMGITPFTIGFERLMTRKSSSIAIAGLHDMDGTWLFVGKGIGASRLQLRIGVRPEIYELRFDC